MNVVLDILVILICIAGLWAGAEWVVGSATNIARKLGMSDLIIGLTIVAIGTSAPEFAVTVVAALEGRSNISVGNVVGSNIFNLGFILGGIALICTIKTSRQLIYRDGAVLLGSTLLLLFFMADLNFSRTEGGILMALLGAYILFLILRRSESEEDIPEGQYRWYTLMVFLAGIAAIVASGHFFVGAATSLARTFGVSEWVIGVTIVAIGTSAPEVATSLVALLKGRYGMSAGNLVGSDIFNVLGVLGLAALLHPMTVAEEAKGSIYLLSIMVVVVLVMMRLGWKITRVEGAILVLITMVRWYADFTR